jgi:hypothetical protein
MANTINESSVTGVIDDDDIAAWCEEYLPELFDVGMFDSEEVSERVWEDVVTLMEEMFSEVDDDARDELTDSLHAAAEDWFRTQCDVLRSGLDVVEPQWIAEIVNRLQVAQHTADWYADRYRGVSASEYNQLFDGRRAGLARRKRAALRAIAAGEPPEERGGGAPVALAQEDGEMTATSWGHRFEPVVRRIYELEGAQGTRVHDGLGSFKHSRFPWLSASPDGLVVEGPTAGRLVEIKAPKTRQPGVFIPEDYYIQMQIQMEVLDLDAVDFVECQFSQRPVPVVSTEDEDEDREELLATMAKSKWVGQINVYGNRDDAQSWRYVYSDPARSVGEIKMPNCEGELLESSYWWLTGWYARTVLRNTQWWEDEGLPAGKAFRAEMDKPDDTIVDEEPTVSGWLGR